MVVAYVSLSKSATDDAPRSRVYALLVPSEKESEWAEVAVRRSPLGGFGLYPRSEADTIWSDALAIPVLLPYFGVETVVKDAHGLKALMEVLKGNFERVSVAELQLQRGRAFVADGLFAVPHESFPSRKPLPPATRLLQGLPPATGRAAAGAAAGAVAGEATGDGALVWYMLEEHGLAALNLAGASAHLFDLLCAHATGEHADRHLATHVASVRRMEADVDTGVISEHHVCTRWIEPGTASVGER